MTAPLATRVVRDSRPKRLDLTGKMHGPYLPLRRTTLRASDGGCIWECHDTRTGLIEEISTGNLRRARRMAR